MDFRKSCMFLQKCFNHGLCLCMKMTVQTYWAYDFNTAETVDDGDKDVFIFLSWQTDWQYKLKCLFIHPSSFFAERTKCVLQKSHSVNMCIIIHSTGHLFTVPPFPESPKAGWWSGKPGTKAFLPHPPGPQKCSPLSQCNAFHWAFGRSWVTVESHWTFPKYRSRCDCTVEIVQQNSNTQLWFVENTIN